LLYLVSLLPYRVLYVISDGIYYILYYLIGYRRKTVRENLVTSFPEKGIQEIKQIEHRFYHWLCDYFLETIKLMSISADQVLKRIEYRNVEEIEKCFDEGQTCAAILGHYCNWEYLSTVNLGMKHHSEAAVGLIYHPLRSKIFDRIFLKLRQHTGGTCVPKKDILRYLVKYRRENRMNLFGYIADQGPKWENIHLWLPFLHHDTPVFTGAERIMRKMNNAVFYADMERPKRGKYICTFRLITRTPNDMPEYGITRRFFEMLEENIHKEPSLYLWTHKRWKRTHEEYDRKVEAGEIKG